MKKRPVKEPRPRPIRNTPTTDTGRTLVSSIDDGASSISFGPLSFDVRMARILEWDEYEIQQCWSQLEGVIAQWTALKRLRGHQNLTHCTGCKELIRESSFSICYNCGKRA